MPRFMCGEFACRRKQTSATEVSAVCVPHHRQTPSRCVSGSVALLWAGLRQPGRGAHWLGRGTRDVRGGGGARFGSHPAPGM